MFGIATILPHRESEDSSGPLRLDVKYFLDGDVSKKGIRPCWISLYLIPILVDGSSLPEEAEYMTLSHCWGVTRIPALRDENEAIYRRNIPWDALTNTFRDAVSYTQALGVEYLWIDAFCINQDKFTDWLEEALSMASIFSNAVLNLAATCSPDGDGGLFSASNPLLTRAFTVKARWTAGFSVGQYAALDDESYRVRIDNAVLNHRAWVLQERLLSPRILHFAADQVYWECHHLRANETWSAGLPYEQMGESNASIAFKRLTPESRDQSTLHGCWLGIVSKYSECLLTNESDKLVALAGLAQVVQQYMGCPATDYLAGLWRRSLVQDLLWSAYTGRQERYQTYQAPSWSWASVMGNVDWSTSGSRIKDHDSFSCELRNSNVQLLDSERHFGPVLSAYIELVAPLCRVELGAADVKLQRLEYLTINGRRFTGDDDLADRLDDHRLYKQIPEWLTNHTAYVCRFATVDSRLEEGLWMSDGLLLERSAHMDKGHYKRLGWVRLFHRQGEQEFDKDCLLSRDLEPEELLWREGDGRYGIRVI
ncbi:hypothetical protein LTS17_005897 [Exophiala oligosperma]